MKETQSFHTDFLNDSNYSTSRQDFLYRLGENGIRFNKLAEGDKRPTSAFGKNKPALRKPPETGNYGFIVTGKIFVLDLDTKNIPLETTLTFVHDVLQVPLDETLTVRSSSGGLHVYLEVPDKYSDSEELPNGALGNYVETILSQATLELQEKYKGFVLDADGRSCHGKSYVVAPGSVVDNTKYGEYVFWNRPIQKMSEYTYELLHDLKSKRALLKKAEKATKNKETKPKRTSSLRERNPDTLESNVLSDELIKRLDARVKAEECETYHAQRSFVYASLHCCYSDQEIARVCHELRIDWDTYTDSEISENALLSDMDRLSKSLPDKEFHGLYCAKSKIHCHEGFERSLEENLEDLRKRVNRRAFSRKQHRQIEYVENREVIDLEKIEIALARVTKTTTLQFQNAIAIVEGVISPLKNNGAERMVLGYEFLMSKFDLTRSQVAQALKILVKSQVIILKDRQKTGMAATYRLNGELINRGASDLLILESYLREFDGIFPAMVVDPRNGSMIEVHTGELVWAPENDSESEYLSEAFAVAYQYSREECEAREELVELDTEFKKEFVVPVDVENISVNKVSDVLVSDPSLDHIPLMRAGP